MTRKELQRQIELLWESARPGTFQHCCAHVLAEIVRRLPAGYATTDGARTEYPPDPPAEAPGATGDAVREALEKIVAWNPPPVWVDDLKREVPYGVQHGSNGEREYFRDIARKALFALAAPPPAPATNERAETSRPSDGGGALDENFPGSDRDLDAPTETVMCGICGMEWDYPLYLKDEMWKSIRPHLDSCPSQSTVGGRVPATTESGDWIPVATRLPEESAHVHATIETDSGSRSVVEMFYRRGQWFYAKDSSAIESWKTVTAWRPKLAPFTMEAVAAMAGISPRPAAKDGEVRNGTD